MIFSPRFMMKNFITIFEASMRRCWKQPALNDFRQEPITYGELATQIVTLHRLWREAGLQPGDKITIQAASTSEWIKLFMATISGGYVAVPLLSGYLPSDSRRLIDHSESRLLYTDRAAFEKMDFEAMPRLIAAIDLRSGDLLATRGDFEAYYQRRAQFRPVNFTPADLAFAPRATEELCQDPEREH